MSQYTFQTSTSGNLFTVVAGFCAKTATFFACVSHANNPDLVLHKSKPLRSDSDVLHHFDKWGFKLPLGFEEALAGDLELWEFGDGSLMSFNRRVKHFGYMEQSKKRAHKALSS